MTSFFYSLEYVLWTIFIHLSVTVCHPVRLYW